MEQIIIKKAILHILDSNITIPVLSSRELEIDSEILEFLENHINKIIEDSNLKSGMFLNEDSLFPGICRQLASNPDFFIAASSEIATHLFNIMIKHVDIVPADLIICYFNSFNQNFIGVLKLNYKSSFTHHVMQGNEGNTNSIIRHRTILPSDTHKIDDCALINLEDLSIKLMEKENEINGEKDFYFSKLFLQCKTELSSSEKVRILDKTAKKINKKYFDEEFDKVVKLKKIVSESLEETNTIEVMTVAKEVFGNNVDIQNEYLSEMNKAGLTENSIHVSESLVEKKFRTHRIKTDNGIEINFPLSYFNNKEKIEFINNPDGTISIIIKNIGKILNK